MTVGSKRYILTARSLWGPESREWLCRRGWPASWRWHADEEAGEQRKRRRKRSRSRDVWLKSKDPHLAGGEQNSFWAHWAPCQSNQIRHQVFWRTIQHLSPTQSQQNRYLFWRCWCCVSIYGPHVLKLVCVVCQPAQAAYHGTTWRCCSDYMSLGLENGH